MTLVDALRCVAEEQNQEAELPDALLAEILEISKEPLLLQEQDTLVRRLLGQLHNFDLYAGAGCFSDSCGVKEINDTLKLLSESIRNNRHEY